MPKHFKFVAGSFLFFSFFIISSTSLANSDLNTWPGFQTSWNPFISFGAGSIDTSDLNHSQNFEIVDPIVDEYFYYSPDSNAQTAGLFDFFFGAEWNLSSLWILQTGLDYDKTGNFNIKGTFIQGADVHSQDNFNYQYNLKTQQLFVEGKLLFGRGHIRPYINAGLGGSANDAKNYQTNVPPFLTFTREYSDNNQTAFAYNVGAGVDCALDEHVRIGVGYRFANLGKVSLGDANIDGIPVSGTLSQSHLYSNEILAQLTFVY